MLSPNEVDVVIYHSPCQDGFTCCSIANMYYKSIQKEVEYIGASHRYHNFPKLFEKIKNKNILICDFSYKKDIMTEIMKITKNVLIIDHHISAMEELIGIPVSNKIFDMKHCGAYLTWNYFFPEMETPLFVKYVEDNDIWTKKMYMTREITAYISLLDFDLELYGELLLQNEEYFEKNVIEKGKILLLQENKQIEIMLKKSTVKMIEYNDNIYFVGMCNSTVNPNETGNKMLEKYDCNFSIVYSIKDNQYNISFRSDDQRTDVHKIAKTCNGGGGHRNASGCILYDKPHPGTDLGDYNSYKQLQDINYLFGDKYNIVVLNSTQNKEEFARYLLQERHNGIQESGYLCNKTENRKAYFNFSIVWHYGKDMILCVLHWKSNNYNIKKMLKKTENLEIIEAKNIAKFGLKMSPFPFGQLFQFFLK